jgi:hypothetical protein
MSVGIGGAAPYAIVAQSLAAATSSAASAAGTSLAQSSGPDKAVAQQDVYVRQRALEAAQETEDAQGIGQTDGDDNQTNERDADGRTPWMIGGRPPAPAVDESAEEPAVESPVADASGERGSHLDLSG